MRTRLDQQKKQHRERAQPLNRQRLGLLEKHKDYVKRAKDYHSKEDRIKKLREKAATRNKDEFYFGMIRSKTEGGVHVQDRGNEAMPVDVVKLLKTQDAGYVRTLISTEEKLIEKLRNEVGSSLVLYEQESNAGDDFDSDDDAEGPSDGVSKASVLKLLAKDGLPLLGKKTVFVDSAKQVSRYQPKKNSLSSAPATTVKATKKAKGKGKAKAKDVEGDEDAPRPLTSDDRKEHLSNLSAELEARLERLALLQRTYREMQVQRSIMGKGSKTVVGNKNGGLSREDERLNEDDLDELELKRIGQKKKKLPQPEVGVRTGARVWKWKAERRR